MATAMIAFKLPADTRKQFQTACKTAGLDQSKFLRACVDKFITAADQEREMFLAELGFKKTVSWSKQE